MKRALITGITGQDGSYLAELLLSKGYEVHGLKRRGSSLNTQRIDHIFPKLQLHYADMTDSTSLNHVVEKVDPQEVYNLAAMSHVAVSFEVPEYAADTIAMGTLRLLAAVKDHAPEARFYQASSSEMFGRAEAPQSELTPFLPRSPYGCAKVFAHQIAVNYRESYGMHVSCGILFNHESPRRGETFVTRKITRAVAAIKAGTQELLFLGNLAARRDWGYAPEYVDAMWRMLQQEQPEDYVIGTGASGLVADFVQLAFAHAGLDFRQYVSFDPQYNRPAEVDHLRANAWKATERLGWRASTRLEALVGIMVDADCARAQLANCAVAW